MSTTLVETIHIRGANTHNLRNITVDIPRHKLVVITGVSGSGKSSLAFDTLHAEGQIRYLECLSANSLRFLNQLSRPLVEAIVGLPPTVCIEQHVGTARARSTVATSTEIHDFLRVLYARAGIAHCPICHVEISRQTAQAIVERILSLESGRKVMLLAPLVRGKKGGHSDVFAAISKMGYVRARVDGELMEITPPPALKKTSVHTIEAVVDRIVIKPGLRDRLTESVHLALKAGNGNCLVSEQEGISWNDRLYSSKYVCPQCQTSFPEVEPRTFSFNSPYGSCETCQGMGVLNEQEGYPISCPDCQGARLSPFSRAVTFNGCSLPEFLGMTVSDAYRTGRGWLNSALVSVNQDQQIASRLLNEIVRRLKYLSQVGLDYLSLDRAANSLSGGEFQRTRLASCLGSGLLGVCYILDEPTVGLHPRDTARLLGTLFQLRDSGATVVVVEHDLDIIRAADYVIDLGPGAGREGGELLAAGTPIEIEQHPASLTGSFLSGRRQFPLAFRSSDARNSHAGDRLTVANVRVRNLKNITVDIPCGTLCAVTGVSGSGKTTLVSEALVPLVRDRLGKTTFFDLANGQLSGGASLQRVVEVDQSPLGRSGRSNPATFSGAWDEIRKLFARTREARVRGFASSRFSFNASGGRCPVCHGHGFKHRNVGDWADLLVACPDCEGRRFNPATLEVRFRGLNVAEVLDLQIKDALEFFLSFSGLNTLLKTFVDVGLGHLRLGQPANTLSGGESQRVKLATELGRTYSVPTLFVLDEPTTGLHAQDVEHLLVLFRGLVDDGHTVLMIEHQFDLVASADWMIDIGPEGGAKGGQVVGFGPPAVFMREFPQSHSGIALRNVLECRNAKAPAG